MCICMYIYMLYILSKRFKDNEILFKKNKE